jgi:hypothetical protein
MACRLARHAESRPYCMLATATMPHISRHFRFAQRDVSGRCVVGGAAAILRKVQKQRSILGVSAATTARKGVFGGQRSLHGRLTD